MRASSTVSLCFLCSPRFCLWHACRGWSAFPETAITIKSISWKPKCFPNCLKSQCEKEVSIDWNMRGNNPKFITLSLFINTVRRTHSRVIRFAFLKPFLHHLKLLAWVSLCSIILSLLLLLLLLTAFIFFPRASRRSFVSFPCLQMFHWFSIIFNSRSLSNYSVTEQIAGWTPLPEKHFSSLPGSS